jgi:hypothetical protein
MRSAQESVKLQFDNVNCSAFSRGTWAAMYRPQTEKHRDPDYIRAEIRRFKDSGCGMVPRIQDSSHRPRQCHHAGFQRMSEIRDSSVILAQKTA